MELNIPPCNKDKPNQLNKPTVDTIVDNNSGLNRFSNDFFTTVLNLPKALKPFYKKVCGDIKDVGIDYLQLSIKNFEIPNITIPTQNTKYLGATRSESSKSLSEFDNITIQFKLDSDLINYNTLYQWLLMLIDPKTGKPTENTKTQYETIYSVVLVDEYEKPIGLYTFYGVIPVSLGAISLDYSTSENVFVDFTFSFDFLSFELNPKY